MVLDKARAFVIKCIDFPLKGGEWPILTMFEVVKVPGEAGIKILPEVWVCGFNNILMLYLEYPVFPMQSR